jgi:F-type H+-transporting ATPase subunit c
MKKTIYTALLSLVSVALSAPMALAQEGMEHAAEAAGTGNAAIYAMVALGCGLGIGLAALGTGIGQGIATNGAMHGISRNPGASGKIMTTMIIGLALIESLCIYALVVVLIMLFVNPYGIF